MTDTPDIAALLADASKLLPIRQAIRIAGVPLSYPSAIRMALAGRLPSVRVGGRRLTTPEAVLATVRTMSKLPERAPTAPRRRRRVSRRSPHAPRAIAAYGITRLGVCDLQDLTAAGRLIAPTSHDVGQSDSCAYGDAVRATERNDV